MDTLQVDIITEHAPQLFTDAVNKRLKSLDAVERLEIKTTTPEKYTAVIVYKMNTPQKVEA